MDEVNTVGEVIELAIVREVQAARFYVELADRAATEANRALFERLANEELRHKARLELEMMKEGLVTQTVGRLLEVDEPDYEAELKAGTDLEYREVLALAIRKERQSFRLYVELAGVVAQTEMHGALLDLAEEEARHLVQFEMEYNRITRKPE